MRWLWISAGGAVGSLLRYGFSLWFSGSRFPWGTLSVNLLGSFAFGLIVTFALGRWPNAITTGLTVGLIGGFTTFSTFAWEAFTLVQGGESTGAVLYLATSLAGGLTAALLGFAAGRVLA